MLRAVLVSPAMLFVSRNFIPLNKLEKIADHDFREIATYNLRNIRDTAITQVFLCGSFVEANIIGQLVISNIVPNM